jgi:hypothetical protein
MSSEQPKRTPEELAALVAQIKAETSGKIVQHPATQRDVNQNGSVPNQSGSQRAARAKPRPEPDKRFAPRRGKIPIAAAEPQASPSLLAWMNERHAVIFDYGGRCVVADIAGQGDTVRTFFTDDFRKRYQNRMVGMGKKSVPLGDWFLTHPHREQYYELVLRPDTLAREVRVHGRRCLNLWRGFAVKPAPGDWGRMRDHVYNVLAAGTRKAATTSSAGPRSACSTPSSGPSRRCAGAARRESARVPSPTPTCVCSGRTASACKAPTNSLGDSMPTSAIA